MRLGVPCIDKELFIFHNLVFQQYWVLTESRIPLKSVLGEVRIIALSISSHEQTQSAVFLFCRFSLFLKDTFSRLFTCVVGSNLVASPCFLCKSSPLNEH